MGLKRDIKLWRETWFQWALWISIALATLAVIYGVSPWFTNMDTRNTRQTIGYVTAHQSALRTMKASYDALAVRIAETPEDELRQTLLTQQRGLVVQMRQEADLLNPGDVPQDIRPIVGR
jgi:hypothetical protein